MITLFLIFFFLWKKQKRRNLELQQEITQNRDNAKHWLQVQELNEYAKICQAHTEQINALIQEENRRQAILAEGQKEFSDFQAKRKAVHEAILHAREIEEKENFYRVCLSEDDIEDISELKKLVPRLRHREALPKLMWDTMVSRATKEMTKRVTGGRTVGGIYKITYIPTGESYIGKTADFATRWQSHIQTALGMEKVARSTLHAHMASHGIQNYTFEILEEVPREKQTEREKFYIELYGTQKQLNMRVG